MKLERTLRRITEMIVRCSGPDEVLLFGSYAKGQDNGDSDLDILVIGHFRGPPSLRGNEIRQWLRRYPIGVDLHLMTREEIEAGLRQPYGFVRSILSSSVVLYTKYES
ncbi:putative nucleotidyltransferase [Paenibacillus forsythiae]|uniref:Nucleotidyltransferase n=1 Tax=Paenibacillus forsythiae TaxID=365616 RepID=A0ABU3H205_9BACL|nr:nucleotidyltransferase domain-containing protein [Paenibacillus forsythiae]MDT3424853.1 putative nucleotidyltransferase [Paenibacillus forsythiae]